MRLNRRYVLSPSNKYKEISSVAMTDILMIILTCFFRIVACTAMLGWRKPKICKFNRWVDKFRRYRIS